MDSPAWVRIVGCKSGSALALLLVEDQSEKIYRMLVLSKKELEVDLFSPKPGPNGRANAKMLRLAVSCASFA